MVNQRNRLYFITGIVCFFGIIWIILDYFNSSEVTVCPFKLVTGYPCPSCGTTRSISALLDGNISEAFMINPLGILSSLLILSVVILLILDLLTKKDYYFRVYRQVEKFLQTHQVFSIILILLVITNWIWNISKEL